MITRKRGWRRSGAVFDVENERGGPPTSDGSGSDREAARSKKEISQG